MGNLQIFLDMDGVIADFTRAAFAAHGRDYDPAYELDWDFWAAWGMSGNEFWAKASGLDFWSNLPMYDHAQDFYVALKDLGEVTILTSPSSDPMCVPGKTAWLKKNLSIGLSDVIFSRKKYLCANPQSVLIDDKPSSCNQFMNAGGSAYVFPTLESSVLGAVDFILQELPMIAGSSNA